MYALVGLGMAYGTYRLGRSQLFSAMFTSLFGRQAIDGVGGRIINILAIVATLFGSACSLGLGPCKSVEAWCRPISSTR